MPSAARTWSGFSPRIERGVEVEQLFISGYWRAGTDDEGWRAGKAAWNSEVEQAEIAAGVS